MESFLFGVEAVTVAATLLSIVYIVGIVWRVEAELDTSYKFFSFAIVFFLCSELLSVYYFGNDIRFALLERMSSMLFALLFLGGAWCMRDIIRKIDGEKPKKKATKRK